MNLARILRSLEWGVKVGQGGGDEDKVYRSAMPRGAATGRRAPRASRRVCGFWSTFLYQLQHEPDRDGDRAPELPADHADLDPAVVGRRSLRQSLNLPF